MFEQTIDVCDVIVDERVRVDLGDVDGLSNSIREFGLIQPIVLGKKDGKTVLVAGGRRLAALKRLGTKTLVHAQEFLWREERAENHDLETRFRAIELEENLKRKELTWQEQLLGKQKLLETMQQIHGRAKAGPRETLSSKPGFGINRLASMLGESPATTSVDLKVAALLTQVPGLRSCKTKSEVLTKMAIATTVVGMQNAKNITGGASRPGVRPVFWTLHELDFVVGTRSGLVAPATADLVWTDLPYGADVNDMSSQTGSNLAGFDDGRAHAVAILGDVARESFKVLREDRYAVFCFGFNYYKELVDALSGAGFRVNLVPVIWVKNTKSGENPNTRYSNSYEPLLVGVKGSPRLLRPGASNVVVCNVVQNKLQAVQKPVELVERFLLDMTAEGATVVDWCAGTGTTGVACHNLKRHAVLFERDPSMATIARARLEALR